MCENYSIECVNEVIQDFHLLLAQQLLLLSFIIYLFNDTINIVYKVDISFVYIDSSN